METQPDLIVSPSHRAARRFSGDDLAHWAWTEPSVWTNYREVAANRGAPGVDNVTIEDFTSGLTRNIDKLEQQLRDGTYRPQSIKRVHIPKPGTNETRPLGIPTVRDRVVQNALRHVLEPILERQFAEHSYGFRPNRGCKDALRRVDELDHKMATAGYEMTRYAAGMSTSNTAGGRPCRTLTSGFACVYGASFANVRAAVVEATVWIITAT